MKNMAKLVNIIKNNKDQFFGIKKISIIYVKNIKKRKNKISKIIKKIPILRMN